MSKVTGGIFGLLFMAIAIVAGALFLGAWIGMLVFGAFAHNTDIISNAPGYWETFFGLWSLSILGTAWNGSRMAGQKSND